MSVMLFCSVDDAFMRTKSSQLYKLHTERSSTLCGGCLYQHGRQATARQTWYVSSFEVTSGAGIEAPSAKAAPAREPVREPVREPANDAQWGSPRGAGGKRREGNKGRVGGLDPVIPFRDAATLDSIVDFFGLPAEFPFREQLVTRSSQDTAQPKRMYYVSSGAILQAGLQPGLELADSMHLWHLSAR